MHELPKGSPRGKRARVSRRRRAFALALRDMPGPARVCTEGPMKGCPKCGETLPLTEFAVKRNGKPASWCRACTRVASRKWERTRSRSERLPPRPADPLNLALCAWRTAEESSALVVSLGVVCELPRWRVAA